MVTSKLTASRMIVPSWIFFLGSAVLVALSARGAAPPGSQFPGQEGTRTGNETKVQPDKEEQARVDALGDPLPPGALARGGTIRLRHDARISCLAVSPDGKIVASAGWNRSYGDPDLAIRLWDADKGKELRELRGHIAPPLRVLFSPDGKTLASLASIGHRGRDETVRLWDVATGRQLQVLEGHRNPDNRVSDRFALAFSPDGRSLASSGADRTVRLWDVGTGKELRCWRDPAFSLALAFSPDGKVLASPSIPREKSLLLLDMNTGEVQRTVLHDCPPSILALQFSPDGNTMVTGDHLGTIQWWAAATGKELRHVEGTLVAGAPDRKLLAIRQKGDILIWDIGADKETQRLTLQDASPPDLRGDSFVGSFSADGSILAIPDGAMIRILDTRTGKERQAFPGHSEEVVFVDFSLDSRQLISAADRSVRFWEPHTGKELISFRGIQDSICGASISADRKTLAVGTRGSAIHIWNLEAGQQLHQLALEPPFYPRLALSPNGKTMAVHSLVGGNPKPRGLLLFDVASGKELRQLGSLPGSDGLAFLPDGMRVAGLCSAISVIDPNSGQEIRNLVDPNEGRRRGLVLSPDGTIAATAYPDLDNLRGSDTCTVSLWEMASGKFIAQFRGHKREVAAFAFTHSGRVVASGGWDGTVRLWDVASGRELRKFEGHRGGVLSLAFSPDDKLLASGGSDTSILVWDVAELTAHRPLPEILLSREEMEKCWTALGADNAGVAYRALCQLAAGGKPVVAFLKEALASNPAAEERVKKLLVDLNADSFEVREKATQELALLGPQAQPFLEKMLEQPPSAEVRRRVEQLLAQLQNPGPGRASELLRQLRAVQALEYGATAEGRQLLQALADKEPDSPRGQAAKASLHRLTTQRR
jgi:WD40 repeat protein